MMNYNVDYPTIIGLVLLAIIVVSSFVNDIKYYIKHKKNNTTNEIETIKNVTNNTLVTNSDPNVWSLDEIVAREG